MDEFEKMIGGSVYDAGDPALVQMRARAHKLCADYNKTYDTQTKKRAKILSRLLPNAQEDTYVQGPLYCDFGKNIKIGKRFYCNFNFTVLDSGIVEIGDDVFIGPNVSLLTPVHPFLPEQRNMTDTSNAEFAKPIKIGSNCWIASNVTIIGGVSIGEGCVIGAGSVVTRDIPPNTLAAGNPCKVIRKITQKDKLDF